MNKYLIFIPETNVKNKITYAHILMNDIYDQKYPLGTYCFTLLGTSKCWYQHILEKGFRQNLPYKVWQPVSEDTIPNQLVTIKNTIMALIQ